MKFTRSKAILSDADGTLLDTLGLIRHGQYETSRTYLSRQGISDHEIPSFDTYVQILDTVAGQTARKTLEDTVRIAFRGKEDSLQGVDFDELHELLNPIQDTIASKYVFAYEGLTHFLEYLGKNQLKLAIFTSGTAHHIVRNFDIALPELGLAGLWTNSALSQKDKLSSLETAIMRVFKIHEFTIVTSENIQNDKPDPEGLHLIMDRLGIDANESLVLGDHSVDIVTGLNAGVPKRVGITHGFHDRQTLQNAGATVVVDSLAEVVKHL